MEQSQGSTLHLAHAHGVPSHAYGPADRPPAICPTRIGVVVGDVVKGEWSASNERQHEPFEPGNRVALTHGAHSARTVQPLAAEIEAAARKDASWPPYLADPSYRPAVEAWAWAEAVVTLLRRYLAGRSFEDALTDTHTEQSTEHHAGGTTTRSTSGKRTRAALDYLARWEATASGHRQRLGLDPLSRMKIGKDIASTGLDLVQMLTVAAEKQQEQQGGAA